MHHPAAAGHYVGAYEYDGIKLLKANVDAYPGGVKALEAAIIRKTKELTGFDLIWSRKDMDKKYDISKELEEVATTDARNEVLEEICSAIEKGMDDTGIIEIVKTLFPNQFVFCKNQWYCWNGSNGINQRHLEHVITYKLGAYWKGLLNHSKQNTQFGYGKSKCAAFVPKELVAFEKCFAVMPASTALSVGRTLLAKVTSNLTSTLTCWFDNGIFDFNEEIFALRFDDYVTWSAWLELPAVGFGMKYTEDGAVKTVASIDDEDTARMSELKDVLTKYYRMKRYETWCCTSLPVVYPRAIEKFFVFNGNGRNGKGLLDELMTYMLTSLCECIAKIPRRTLATSVVVMLTEKAKLNKKRYVFMKEPAREPLKNNESKILLAAERYRSVCCIPQKQR